MEELRSSFYTLGGQERDILERLELERHQRLQLFGIGRRKAVEGLLDGGLKVGERRVVATVQGASLAERRETSRSASTHPGRTPRPPVGSGSRGRDHDSD